MASPMRRFSHVGRLAVTVVLLAGTNAIVRGDPQGLSFYGLAPEYAQHVFAVTDNLSLYLGGVVVLQNGDVIASECAEKNARLHRFSAATTTTVQGTPVHPDALISTAAGGCGMALHPNGLIYSNIKDTALNAGVTEIQITPSGATVLRRFGRVGNALGIAVDPGTTNLFYFDAGCTPNPPTGFKSCSLVEMKTDGTLVRLIPLSTVTFGDGLAIDPSGTFIFVTDRLPKGAQKLLVLDRATGSILQSVLLPNDPVGMGFSASSPKFVITNNQDGTMTRLDFPGDNYRLPPAITAFASNGFRGDFISTGPDSCVYVTQLGVRYNNGYSESAPKNSIVQICDGFAPPPGVTPNPPPPPSSLCGAVYNDVNNDGSRGGSEAGIAGVAISLNGTDTLNRSVLRSTSTASDGAYCFNDLKAGTYNLGKGAIPIGYLDGKDTAGSAGGTVGSDAFTSIPLAAGVDGRNYNFGELAESLLAGYVYVDANDNGIRDASEAPIAGVKVTLSGPDDRGIVVTMIGTTGTDGRYMFTALRPGSYTITESQPPGYRDGKDTQGTPGTGVTANDTFAGILLLPGTNGTDNNFGELPPAASFCGAVYEDANNDGMRGTSEPGIAGVKIALAGKDDVGRTVSRFITTGPDGSYCFNDLEPGVYTISEGSSPALAQFLDGRDTAGTPATGTVGNDAFTNVDLRPGTAAVNNNFGEIRPSSLAGFVYLDANDNGLREPSESAIPGVSIQLTYTDDRESKTVTTLTDASGRYGFTSLRPGTYAIAETQPAAYRDGKDSVGTAGAGSVANDAFSNITLATNVAGDGYNFGERLLQDDLRLTVSVPGTVTSGAQLTYSFTATNGGPSVADGVVMTTDIPATMAFTSMTPPAGWTCTSPKAGATGTIRCEKTSMALTDTATLTVTAFVTCTYPSPGAVPVAGQITSTTPDLDAANNIARGTTTPVYPVVTVTKASVTQPNIWPPNHKKKDIGVNYTVGGGCGPVKSTLTVDSDEGDDKDWDIVDDHLVQVTSERKGTGDGRTYTITITARDAHGSSAKADVEVFVPHDQGNGKGKK